MEFVSIDKAILKHNHGLQSENCAIDGISQNFKADLEINGARCYCIEIIVEWIPMWIFKR